ncbi:MAG: hypothetical protein WC294_08200 [Methanoregula sp.]|jgi:hypothetical protein
MIEKITKACHSSGFLADEIREAHSAACRENPVLAILLMDLLGDAVKIEHKLRQVEEAITEGRR